MVESFVRVEEWTVAERHLGSKLSAAKIRPVANFPVGLADNIRQAVSGKVCQDDALVGRLEVRGGQTSFFVVELSYGTCEPKPPSPRDWYQREPYEGATSERPSLSSSRCRTDESYTRRFIVV